MKTTKDIGNCMRLLYICMYIDVYIHMCLPNFACITSMRLGDKLSINHSEITNTLLLMQGSKDHRSDNTHRADACSRSSSSSSSSSTSDGTNDKEPHPSSETRLSHILSALLPAFASFTGHALPHGCSERSPFRE